MPTTDWKNPTSVVNHTGLNMWTNPGDAAVRDTVAASYASVFGSDPTALQATGFDLSEIPLGAEITLIEVVRETMSALSGTWQGRTQLYVDASPGLVDAEGFQTFTILTDLTSTFSGVGLPTLDQLQDPGFGVLMKTRNTSGANGTANQDGTRLRVTYLESGSTVGTFQQILGNHLA